MLEEPELPEVPRLLTTLAEGTPMKIVILVARVLLGLGFTVFGANILHSFLPQPPPVAGSYPAQFMSVMFPTHWMDLVGFFQLAGGLLVLSGRMLPLGLAILAPVLVNILSFHIFLDGGNGIAPGLVFSVLEIFLIYSYRPHFLPLFTTNAKPV
jgi:putative oxidoreductase